MIIMFKFGIELPKNLIHNMYKMYNTNVYLILMICIFIILIIEKMNLNLFLSKAFILYKYEQLI